MACVSFPVQLKPLLFSQTSALFTPSTDTNNHSFLSFPHVLAINAQLCNEPLWV